MDGRSVHTEGDIGTFLRGIAREPSPSHRAQPLLGIDECFNRREIAELARDLVRSSLIDGSGPLWYETRERDGVIVGSFAGGVDRDSAFRSPDSLIPDIGVPIKRRSWIDYKVVQMLVAEFTSRECLFILTENTRNDKNGLRDVLSTVVAPALKDHPAKLSLTALFKSGRTSIEDYVSLVRKHIAAGTFPPGYNELLL